MFLGKRLVARVSAHPPYFRRCTALSWQLKFEDQPPYASWVASRDRRAMHAHVSSYSAGCTFKSAPYGLAVDVLSAHGLRSSN